MSVCDAWGCGSHLETMRKIINKLLRIAEQEDGKDVSFYLHLHAFKLNNHY